ncbi:hypothetical protein BTVI_20818 [Pitangus sulphuratus]|nr:hypothetical protein BTVI_20818 [Pitangus sulphuratus]
MSTAAVMSTSPSSSSSSDSTAMPVFPATALYELRMITTIEILHNDQSGCDQLKPFLSKHSHASDGNFPKEARMNFFTQSWQTSDDHRDTVPESFNGY